MKLLFAIIAFSLILTACGGSTGDPPENDAPTDFLPRSDVRDLDPLFPYIQDGSYADVLAGCMTIVSRDEDIITSAELRPDDMTVGVDWCTNLAPPSLADGIQSRNWITIEEQRAAEHRLLLEEMRETRLRVNH